jgi:DNA polymerase III alpha subunit (gram-positive type)
VSDFVHLHLHTTYSLLDGQCQINPLVERARRWGMPALAVTDHGNLFALKAFYDDMNYVFREGFGTGSQTAETVVSGLAELLLGKSE